MKKYFIALSLCVGLMFGACSSETAEEPGVNENTGNVSDPSDDDAKRRDNSFHSHRIEW